MKNEGPNNNRQRPEGMTMQTQTMTVDYEASLAELWEQHLGFIPNYPASWEDHVEPLMTGLDYVIPDGGLDYLADVGLLVAPGPEAWQPDDIVFLIGAMETMRWYREAPDSIHWLKLSKYQRGRAIAQAEGTFDRLAKGMDKFSFRHLALMVLQAKDKDQLDKAFASLETKLLANGLD